MSGIYELAIVKDGKISIMPDKNHLTEKMSEVTWSPYREGNLPGNMLGATTNAELRSQVLKYPLTASDPWALMK